MAAPIPKGQSNTYGTPAPIAVPEAKNATAQPLKVPASAAFMPAPTMPGFSARTSTTPGAIQPPAPPIPQAVPQAPPGSPPAAPAAPAAPAKPSQAPLPPTAPKGAPVAPKTPPVAPAPSTGFVSTDLEVQRRIAEMQKQVMAQSSSPDIQRRVLEMQKQVMAQSSFGRVDAPSGTEAAKNANAAIKNLGAPYLTTDSKATIESGFSPSQTGIVTTKGYTTARNELGSAISAAERQPIDQVTSETEKMLSGIIKANTDEYNRLTGLAGEFDAENNPTFQLLMKRQAQIARRMEEAVQNIQAQTDVDLRAQEKLNKDLEGKARAALNAAGQVGSMVGEGFMAAQMQNNLDALQSIKAAAAKAASDARYAFENEQDEVAFQMVALAENRKKQAQELLEKNADIAIKMEGMKQQREQFASQMLSQTMSREVTQLELEGKREQAAQAKISRLIALGNDFNENTAPAFMEAAKGTNWSAGDLKTYVSAVKRDTEAQRAKTEIEQQKLSIDAFKDLYSMLDKVPAGDSINFNGSTYYGTQGTGKVEIDENGEGRLARVDQETGEIRVVNLGKLGKTSENWKVKEDDQGRLWRVNSNTGQLQAIEPGETQADWQQVFPEGSVSPFKDAQGRPRVQCGAFVNDLTGAGVGDTFESKIAKTDKSIGTEENPLRVGDFFVQKLGTWTGHVGIVSGVEIGPDGKTYITALESNYPQKGKVTSTRQIAVDSIDGFGRTGYLNPILQTGSDRSPEEVAEVPGAVQREDRRVFPPTFGLKTKTDIDRVDEINRKAAALAKGTVPLRLIEKDKDASDILIAASEYGYKTGESQETGLNERQIKMIETSPEAKQLLALQDMKNKLKAYRTIAAERAGFDIMGKRKAVLDSLYADLKLAAKEAANLGALTGPDVTILTEVIKPMSGITNYPEYLAAGGQSGVLGSLDTAMDTLQKKAEIFTGTLEAKWSEYRDDPYIRTLTAPFKAEKPPTGAQPKYAPAPKGQVTVRKKDTGDVGYVPEEEFDAAIYEKI